METERVADAHREQENETVQIPPGRSRENSLDRQSRGYSPERDTIADFEFSVGSERNGFVIE